MSGDVQPRKRKEKRRKKEESEDLGSLFSQEENLHIHKDHGTGGNICAKIIFFLLFALLVGAVGLVYLEYRGTSDVDTPVSESKWAPLFAGWVDESPEKHDHADIEREDHDEDHENLSHEESEEHKDSEEKEDEHVESNEEEEADDERDDDNDVEQGEDEEEEEENNDSEPLDKDDEGSEEIEDIPGINESLEDDNDLEGDGSEDEADNVSEGNYNEGDDEEEEGETSRENVQESEEEKGELRYEGDDGDDDNDDDAQELRYVSEEEDNEGTEDAELDADLSKEEGNEEREEEDEPEPSGVPSIPKQDAKVTSTYGKQLEYSESEDEDDEPAPVLQPAKKPSASGGKNYIHADITNDDEWIIQNDLDYAEDDLGNKPEVALQKFMAILSSHPNSPRAWYGKAKALDELAEKKHSNALLEQAIQTYLHVLKLAPKEKLFLLAAERSIDRMRFRGQHNLAEKVHLSLIRKFPDDPSHRNQLAVTYLMRNRLSDAKRILEETLNLWPNNGFAQAHYGFILKTKDNDLERAVDYLTKGIASREPGTIDGRFFFQLSDALLRLNRREEALKINEIGVGEGLFLSKYQRSLYNVNRLKAKPWWTLEETTYQSYFREIENNWKSIKMEGLRALNNETNYFKDEVENLKDFGTWKQFELYARGRKITSNCERAPVTCNIIDRFPAASKCQRGQVKFSVMHPKTHVWPHCGPTNCRLRAHLGLLVPEKTFIRVGEETRSWEEGKLFIFDDSFEHEVWHNGTSIRLVLIIDVWHPELTENERTTLPAI